MDYSEYFRATRIESWLGWIFSFDFGSIFIVSPALWRVISIFFAFYFATASIFILNQFFDLKGGYENKNKSDLSIASGRIAHRSALALSLSLNILCLFIVFLVDANLMLLFLVYFVLWTAYSGSFIRLKTVPVMDFIISGIGVGLLPFLIGAGTSY
jgi:4-hydroxybenzoate polyprenyltransferase